MRPSNTVYPRERGEQALSQHIGHLHSGLSPRTRGTAVTPVHAKSGNRFIPANAGNRQAFRFWRFLGAVYPRERGEQSTSADIRTYEDGLSPRTRGTGRCVWVGRVGSRFIPANAGNSPASLSIPHPQPVYPRERGEQFLVPCICHSCAGLSPRTRGTERLAAVEWTKNRFIPANAGNRAT